MALKSNFDRSQNRAELNLQKQEIMKRVVDSFIMAGEKFVKDARSQVQDHEQGTYLDRTANLRNSIGYFVFQDGELVVGSTPGNAQPNLKYADKAEDPGALMEQAKSAVQDKVQPRGIQLIVIAGMNYASYVESKGYNVISYQADTCILDLTLYLEKLGLQHPGAAAELEETFMP